MPLCRKEFFPYLINSLHTATSCVAGLVIYLLMPLHCSFQEWHDEIDTCNTYDKVTKHSCIFSFFFFPHFFISRNSKTLKNWGNLCLCFLFLVSVNVQEFMKSFFLFYSIFLLTRRCGSVYLGVVVPRV